MRCKLHDDNYSSAPMYDSVAAHAMSHAYMIGNRRWVEIAGRNTTHITGTIATSSARPPAI